MAQPPEQIETRSTADHLAGRNGLIDALRFLAAAWIVVFHTNAPGAAIGYVALPLFTLYLAHYASSDIQRALYFLRLWIIWLELE